MSSSWLRRAAALATVALVVPVGVQLAYADEISNNLDTSIDATAEVMNLSAGTSGTTGIFVQPRNGDGKNGCNFGDGNEAGELDVTFASSNTSIATVSPSSLTFSNCGTAQQLTVSAVSAGSANVTATITRNTTPTSFTTTSATFTVNVIGDSSAPVITKTISGTPGANGWYTSNVTVTWTVTDAQSAVVIDSGCHTQVLSTESADASSSCVAHSAGGSSSDSVSVKIDKSGPSAVLNPTGTLGMNGWFTSNVNVSTTGVDDISGVVTCTSTQLLATETGGQTVNGSCTNGAGLSTNATPLTVKIDKTGPSATLAVTAGNLGDNGWYTSNVIVTASGADAISDGVTCTAAQTLTSETDGTDINGSCTNAAGLTTPATTLTVKLDKTSPSASISLSGTLGANGWYTSQVDATTNGADTISDPVVCTGVQHLTADTSGQAVNGSCENDAGLVQNAETVVVKLDQSAPTNVVLSVTAGTTGTNGWYTSDVTVATTGSDAVSGVTCTADQTVSAEGTSVVNGSCTNGAGLTTHAAPLSIKIDKSGPSAVLAVTAGTAGANGWYTSDVTVSTTGTDSISGSVTCTPDQSLTDETIGQAVTGTCTNAAGLTTNATPITVRIDKTGPSAQLAVASGTEGDNDWYVTDVTVTTSGADSISGGVTCTAAQNLVDETAGQSVTGSCTNAAGLSTAATPITIKIDKTGPSAELAVTAGTPGANGWYITNVVVGTSGDDDISGLAYCTDPQTLDDETQGVDVEGICVNGAGIPTQGSLSVKIDKTGPSAVLNANGELGDNGWFISDVVVSTTGSDDVSSPVTCVSDQSFTSETAGQAVNGSCTNDAGLTTQATQISIKIDTSGPSASLAVIAGTLGSNGWYTSDVTVRASGVDAVSGLASCTSDVSVITETDGTTVTGSCTNNAGLTTTAAPLMVKLDKTNPTASISLSGTLGANGWYTSPVEATTNGSDTVSDPVTCTSVQNLTADTAGETVNGSCTNDAGLVEDADSVIVKIDQSPPTDVILAVTGGTPGTNGWYTSDVTVTTTGTDTISGVTCTTDQTVTAEGTTVVNGSCTNGAGLITHASPLSVKIDKTGPSALLSVTSGTLGSNGWYTSDVTVATSGTDSISGPVSCTADQQLTNETAGQVVNGSCTNAAGLTTTAEPLTIKLDKTAPTATLSANGTLGMNGWYVSDITVSTTGSDTISEPVVCSASVSITTDTMGQTVDGQCTNEAGLTGIATSLTVKRDATRPSVALVGGPADGSSHYFGSVPAAPMCTASDAMSQLASVCTVAGYSASVGVQTVTASAEDNAGNVNSASRTYTVLGWTAKGFYQPVDMGNVVNVVKGGSTVPLKFELFAGPTELTTTAAIKSFTTTTITCGSLTALTSDEIEITSTGGTSLRYDTTGGQFIQNWQTPKQAGVCYRVTMTAADGSAIVAYFKTK